MASTLSKQRDYKHIAEKYSNVNEPQIKYGKKLLLGVKRGDKVLDMGCGTGEITAFIADLVGEEHGEVLGIDPDQERIKIAIQNHSKTKRNLTFMVGDSSSHFPHHNEEYYDVHYSNFVFHWLTAQEKDVFLKTAISSLKPGGSIAIQCVENLPEVLAQVAELFPDEEIENNRAPLKMVEKSIAESMLLNSGFEIVSSDYDIFVCMFSNLDHYLTWHCASSYADQNKIVPHKKEEFAKKFVKEDGTVDMEQKNFRIIAKKTN